MILRFIIRTVADFIANLCFEAGISIGIAGVLLDALNILWLANYVIGPILAVAWAVFAILLIICFSPLTLLVSACEAVIMWIPIIGDLIFVIYTILIGIVVGIGLGIAFAGMLGWLTSILWIGSYCIFICVAIFLGLIGAIIGACLFGVIGIIAGIIIIIASICDLILICIMAPCWIPFWFVLYGCISAFVPIAYIVTGIIAIILVLIQWVLSALVVGIIISWPGLIINGIVIIIYLAISILLLPVALMCLPVWAIVLNILVSLEIVFVAGVVPLAQLALIGLTIALILGIVWYLLILLPTYLIFMAPSAVLTVLLFIFVCCFTCAITLLCISILILPCLSIITCIICGVCLFGILSALAIGCVLGTCFLVVLAITVIIIIIACICGFCIITAIISVTSLILLLIVGLSFFPELTGVARRIILTFGQTLIYPIKHVITLTVGIISSAIERGTAILFSVGYPIVRSVYGFNTLLSSIDAVGLFIPRTFLGPIIEPLVVWGVRWLTSLPIIRAYINIGDGASDEALHYTIRGKYNVFQYALGFISRSVIATAFTIIVVIGLIPEIGDIIEALFDLNTLVLVPARRLFLDWLLPLLPADAQKMIYTVMPREMLRWALWHSRHEYLSKEEIIYETPKVGVFPE